MKQLLLLISFGLVFAQSYSLSPPHLPDTLYVNHAIAGGDGTSWETAFSSLQDALDNFNFEDQIWVAKGTYYPSSGAPNLVTSNNVIEIKSESDNKFIDRGKRFYINQQGTAIYGGFAGGETTISGRSNYGIGETNETILSGDIGTLNDNSDNCYHVVFFNLNNSGSPSGNFSTTSLKSTKTTSDYSYPTVFDGFTVSGGNANIASSGDGNGGGILTNGSAPLLINNCTFTENSAWKGGGMCNDHSSPTITNCKFIRNTAEIYAGGVMNTYSSPTITNCTFIGNTSFRGGGMYNYSSPSKITNCTFSGNNASHAGGGMYNSNNSPIIINSIFWDNSSPSGAQIYTDPTFSTPVFSFNNIQSSGGSSSWDVGLGTNGGNNIATDPKFVGAGAHPYLIDGISPCVDAGNSSANSELYDIRGAGFGRKLKRLDGSPGTIDMGAYEYNMLMLDPYSPNHAPVATNDSVVAFENIPIVVDVLDNDWDVDQDVLKVFISKQPTSGGTVYVLSNKITYRSPKQFSGNDVFEYQVCDNGSPIKCSTAKVFVKVEEINDLVVIDHEIVVMDEDASFSGDLTDAGDSDPEGTELLATITPLVAPANGILAVSADGLFTYTPNANYFGTDLAVIKICDQGLPVKTCLPDSIFITVNSVNDKPVATSKSVTVEEDAVTINIDISGNISDVENNGLATTIISGSATFSSLFELAYTPAANFNGSDLITYSVCDDLGACDTGVVNITVTPVNDPPVVTNTIGDVQIDLFATETISLVDVFTDIDAGDVLTYEVTLAGGSPLPTWMVYNQATMDLVCSPANASEIGIYNLVVTATDGSSAQAVTDFMVTVLNANTISGYIYLGDETGTKSGLITQEGEAGDPAVGVLLVLSYNGEFVDSTRTDNDGFYIFYNLAPLKYDIEVFYENISGAFEIEVTADEEAPVTEGFNFTIWPASAIITDVELPGNSFKLTMYPNPSTGKITLEIGATDFNGATVSVCNIAGQKMHNQIYSENRIHLNLENQVSGMYYVKVTTGSSEVVKKLVLSKK